MQGAVPQALRATEPRDQFLRQSFVVADDVSRPAADRLPQPLWLDLQDLGVA